MSYKVVVPVGIVRGTALRRHQRVLPFVLHAHQRNLADRPRSCSAHRDDDDWNARLAERAALKPARALVELHLVAHPLAGTRYVFSFESRHARSLSGGRRFRDGARQVFG